jgi:excisionase family DNA binding protein
MEAKSKYIIGACTLAKELGVHRVTVVRWVKEGKISASKPGQQYIFERERLERELAPNNNMEL